MKRSLVYLFCVATLLIGCAPTQKQTEEKACCEGKNPVIETIMARRSIRNYKDQPVEREKLQEIAVCGVNAPNAINRQAWEVRIVDNAEYINGITEAYAKNHPKAAEEPGFKNMFRNAPAVILIANDTTFGYSQVDCGLMAENMMLAAQSMGLGTVCLGGPIGFMNSNPDAAPYLERLGLSENYQLLVAIAVGYPNESPAARPRDLNKIKFVE